MKELLQKEADKYGFGISKKGLVSKVYWAAKADDINLDICIVNDRYLKINGIYYQFIKSHKENRWIVKEF